ncbi:MAG TPA: Gfo/Idh/MocA family oxidoreductase [Chthoniobacteraceae bacterium]|nr:Gfo/Idh/MocA family oxidoreductase [Chthoniobacteraceae bacterium]
MSLPVSPLPCPPVPDASRRTRYVLCGLSIRSIHHFVTPLTGRSLSPTPNDFTDCAELTAVLDIDPGRVEAFNRKSGLELTCYRPEEFSRMIETERPDVVLVAGPDHTHFDYILQALDHGCDVIAEKPMVLSAEEAKQVIEAEERTGRRVTVTMNLRYKPLQQRLRRLIASGAVGRIVNIDFTYNLDTEHGASYFFRWNRQRALSGGLNVHKLCHHFDVVNWWLDDRPARVFAFGDLNFYGANGAHKPTGENGAPLPLPELKARCPYYRKHLAAYNDPATPRIKAGWDEYHLPYDRQYPPDQAAYLYDGEIDIEDTYGVLIRYRKGAILNYSINFSAAWEGFNIGINGTHGRIETSYRRQATFSENGEQPASGTDVISVIPLFEPPYQITVPSGSGGHGGADEPIQRDLFRAVAPESVELGLTADSIQGAYAVAAGEAVWLSCRSGQPVEIPRFEALRRSCK